MVFCTRNSIVLPNGPNQRWSLDFAPDALKDDRRFGILTVIDDFNHEKLKLVADMPLSGLRVARELDRVIAERSKPKMNMSDNSTAFISMAILELVQKQTLIGSTPRPENFCKRFHRKLKRQVTG